MNVATPVSSLEEWLETVETVIKTLKIMGVDLLVMPEYSCIGWLHFRPEAIGPKEEASWLADIALRALPALDAMVAREGVSLMAGTFPHRRGYRELTNRAHLIMHEGIGRPRRRIWQDKLFLTPEETDPHAWMLAPGHEINVVRWRGHRIVILICHDNTVKALTQFINHDLGLGRINLILAPTMTDRSDGKINTHASIFRSIKENCGTLGAFACAVGPAGTMDLAEGPLENIGGAAVYTPGGHTLGKIPQMASSKNIDGSLLIVKDVFSSSRPLGAPPQPHIII